MRSFSARRALSACVILAASLVALAVPGVAGAEIKIERCKGSAIEGTGSSLQAEAQVVWDATFNTSAAKTACKGGPKVSYLSSSSGTGYKQWQELEKYGTFGFIGTDNTANTAEIEKIEEEASPKKASKLLTVPVLQSAVAVVMNLPTGCTGTSAVAAGRLVLNQATLEGIYKGDVTTWNQIEGEENGGNKLEGGGCTPASDPIVPVVREDGSGTTHIFKRLFALIDTGSFASEDGGTYNWTELAEGTNSKTAGKKLNQIWPTAAKVLRAPTSGNPGVLKAVDATPGSIGYANLADARNPANGSFAKGGKEFWIELENSRKEKPGKAPKRKYADPSTNGLSTTLANSNCKKTVFVNGKKEFPPPSLESAWNEVGTDTVSKTYALCGLTYDFALTKYGAYSGKGATEAEAATVRDFLKYVTDKKGGQKDMEGHDYLPMPKELMNEDKEGLEKIDF